MHDPKKWAFASDVDGTWTEKRQGALVKVVDECALPPSANEEMAALRASYMPLAKVGGLSYADEMSWLRQTLDIYIRHRLTRQAWQAALDQVALRDGVVETYAWCAAVGLPTCAVSYGVADFIEYLATRRGIPIGGVYATRLIHDGDLLVGYASDTLTIPVHKGERSRHFADLHGVPHARLIGVGDTGGDRFIGHLKRHRIGIAETEEEAERLRDLCIMGEVHITQTFHPVLASIKRRLGLS